MKEIIDYVVYSEATLSLDHLLVLVMFYIGIAAVSQALDHLSPIALASQSTLLSHSIDDDFISKVNSFEDVSVFEDADFYDHMVLAQHGAGGKVLSLFNGITSIFGTIISLVVATALVIDLSVGLASFLIVCAVPGAFLQFRFNRKGWELLRSLSNIRRKIAYFRSVLTQRAYAKEIRLFGLRAFFHRHWTDTFMAQFRAERRHRISQAIGKTIGALVTIAGAAVGYVYVVRATVRGEVTVGSLPLLFAMVQQLINAASAFVRQTADLYDACRYHRQLLAFLDLKPRLTTAGTKAMPVADSYEVVFRNVCFSYPGDSRTVLQGVSFEVPAGATVGIVGPNGSGKSTIVSLLCRLYDPTSGAILVNGIDIREFQIDALRNCFSVVFQDYCRYSMTLAENIGLGALSSIDDMNSILRAAQRSGASDLIKRFPGGLNTQLGREFQGGMDLSVGEWQKVAIARASLRNSRILVLDEPTAALDAESERNLCHTLERVSGHTTTLLIAHRLSTLRMVDRIIVLDQGKVVELGNHDTLVERGGLYAQMVHAQTMLDRVRSQTNIALTPIRMTPA